MNQGIGDQGAELHLGEDVLVKVMVTEDFNKPQAFRHQFKDGAFGDIEHLLASRQRRRSVEADMLNFTHKLGLALGEEGAAEDQAAGTLGDVHKTSDSGKAVGEAGDVDTALRIHLHGAKHRDVDAATVIKIELGRLIDDGFGEVAAAEA